MNGGKFVLDPSCISETKLSAQPLVVIRFSGTHFLQQESSQHPFVFKKRALLFDRLRYGSIFMSSQCLSQGSLRRLHSQNSATPQLAIQTHVRSCTRARERKILQELTRQQFGSKIYARLNKCMRRSPLKRDGVAPARFVDPLRVHKPRVLWHLQCLTANLAQTG